MTTQCCTCRKICIDDRWGVPSTPLPADERVSHGYCPECAKAAMRQVESDFADVNGASMPVTDRFGRPGLPRGDWSMCRVYDST